MGWLLGAVRSQDGTRPSARKRPQDAATPKMGVEGARCSGHDPVRKMRCVRECCSGSVPRVFRGRDRDQSPRPLPLARWPSRASYRLAFLSVAQRLGNVGFYGDVAFCILTCTSWARLVPWLGRWPGGGVAAGRASSGTSSRTGSSSRDGGLLQGGVLPRFASASLSMPSSQACGRRRQQRRLQFKDLTS